MNFFTCSLGDHISTSKEFFVCIEKQVAEKHSNFLHALVYQFCSFYVFNLEYPEGNVMTMEFFQR